MPSRNIIRYDGDGEFYHVYARGINKSDIFPHPKDKDYFLYLLARHLPVKPTSSKIGYTYPHFRGSVELLTYCLMDNHFHLLFYQVTSGSLSPLMKSIPTAYVAYFNRTYHRTGPLFESRFKASLVDKDPYLTHVSRYIHLNPRYWKRFPYSSLQSIQRNTEPEWLQSAKILEQFASRHEYTAFVADYEACKKSLDDLKHQLANT